MAVKSRSVSPDEISCDEEGPWRRYDEAKRCNGPGVRSSDVTYDANDDIIMFKLKLADQYRELEPEDKVRVKVFHNLCHEFYFHIMGFRPLWVFFC